MKRIVCVLAAFCFTAFTYTASAGWTTSEIVSEFKEAFALLGNEVDVLEKPVMLYGTSDGSIWKCCDIETTDDGATFHKTEGTAATPYYSFTKVLIFGEFDDEDSLDEFLQQFLVEVEDKWGEKTTEYIWNTSDLTATYNAINAENESAMKAGLTQVRDKIIAYTKSLTGGGGSSGGGSGEGISDDEAKGIEEIKDAIDDLKDQEAEQIKELQDKSGEVSGDLKEAEIELAKYDDEKAKEASQKISDSLTSFDTALSALETAIENNDFEALSGVNANLDAMMQSMNDAIAAISGLQGEGYAETIAALNAAITTVQGAKLNISLAAVDKDMSRARSALTALQGINRLADARKAINHAIIMGRKAKGLRDKSSTKLNLIIALIESYTLLYDEVEKVQSTLNEFMDAYMRDMNRIGAYLGSTNAMCFVTSGKTFCNMDKGDIKRWFKFSVPENIPKNPPFYSSFNVQDEEAKHGGYFYTIMHNLQSQYYLQALTWPSLEIIKDHYNMPSISTTNMRGFYEQPEDPVEQPGVTNWYANNITAPKNWADGTSICVTNGVYAARFSASTEHNGATETPKASEVSVPVNVTASGHRLVFRSADDSDVRINVSTNKVTGDLILTFGVYWK